MSATKSWSARRRSSTRTGRNPRKTNATAIAAPSSRSSDAPHSRRGSGRVDHAQAHEAHSGRLPGRRPERDEVDGNDHRPCDPGARLRERVRRVPADERDQEDDHRGSRQEEDVHGEAVDEEGGRAGAEAGIGHGRLVARRGLRPRCPPQRGGARAPRARRRCAGRRPPSGRRARPSAGPAPPAPHPRRPLELRALQQPPAELDHQAALERVGQRCAPWPGSRAPAARSARCARPRWRRRRCPPGRRFRAPRHDPLADVARDQGAGDRLRQRAGQDRVHRPLGLGLEHAARRRRHPLDPGAHRTAGPRRAGQAAGRGEHQAHRRRAGTGHPGGHSDPDASLVARCFHARPPGPAARPAPAPHPGPARHGTRPIGRRVHAIGRMRAARHRTILDRR